MIGIRSSGSSGNTENFLNNLSKMSLRNILDAQGRKGVSALAAATPAESGLAANSWNYRIEMKANSVSIVWYNSDVENGFPVAIALQYGYSTGTGGYVAGRDYINPAMRPIFDEIAAEVWREVTRG